MSGLQRLEARTNDHELAPHSAGCQFRPKDVVFSVARVMTRALA